MPNPLDGNYMDQGGVKWIIGSSGELEVGSGGTVDLQSGSTMTVAGTMDITGTWKISGTAVSVTAAELNALDASITVAASSGKAAGAMVYISGYSTLGYPKITHADADNMATRATYVVAAAISTGGTGTVRQIAQTTGLNTSGAAAVGDIAYLSATAGGWTFTAPTGAGQIVQEVGYAVTDSTNGTMMFYPGLGKIDRTPPGNIVLARGSILQGGTSGYAEPLDANNSGYVLVGDGNDVASVAMSGNAQISSAGVVTLPFTQNSTTDTTMTNSGFSTVSAGSSQLNGSTASKCITLAAPVAGALKFISAIHATTATIAVWTDAGATTITSTGGAAYRQVKFDRAGQFALLAGQSATKWHVVGFGTGVVFATT